MSENNFSSATATCYEELLLNTVETGSLEGLKQLLSRGYDINQSDFKGVTPLMVAVKNDYKEIVMYLCNNCANIDKPTNNGETALYIACDKVHRDIVEILLNAGSDVNATTNHLHPQTGRSPLMAALPSTYEIDMNKKKKSEAINIVWLLLSYGCDIDARDWTGNTSLHLAADRHDLYTVCLLAEKGANLHMRNNFGLTAFEEAIQPNIQRYDIAAILLLHGYDFETVKPDTHPLLSIIKGIDHTEAKYFTASHSTRKSLLELLLNVVRYNCELEDEIRVALRNCSNISSHDKNFFERLFEMKRPRRLQDLCRYVIRNAIGTSLIKGIRSLPVAKSIKHFLAFNFDIDRNDPLRILELNCALEEGDELLVEKLVASDIDLNVSFSKQTPLTEAARMGNSVLCAFLLDYGAKADLQDNVGMTALLWAASRGHQSVVELLIKHGADVNKSDALNYENAVIKAASGVYFKTMTFLLENCGNPHTPNSDGTYVMHLAVAEGSFEATETLLAHGVSPETRDRNWNTPLHIAASRGLLYTKDNVNLSTQSSANNYCSVINLLLKAGADKAAINIQNKTALDIAVEYSIDDIASLLTG